MPTHYQGNEPEVTALDAYIKLTRCCDSLTARLSASGAFKPLTETQFGVLEALYHLGPMVQNVLGRKLLKSTANITLVLDNLERIGLVERRRQQDDRRRIQIHLTPAGVEQIEKILPRVVTAITNEMQTLLQEEQAELGRLCKKLGTGLRAVVKPGAPSTTASETGFEQSKDSIQSHTIS